MRRDIDRMAEGHTARMAVLSPRRAGVGRRELLEGTVRDKVERCPRVGAGGVNPLFGFVLGLSRGDGCLDRSGIVGGCWLEDLVWFRPGAIFLKVI